VGLAYPIASSITGDDAAGLGDKDSRFGGLCRNGAQHTPEAAARSLLAVRDKYDFEGGRIKVSIRDGLFVGDETFSPYDGEAGTSLPLPVNSTQTSAINAEFICRGSFVEPSDRITLPTTGQ
jgi:hypothetical protein